MKFGFVISLYVRRKKVFRMKNEKNDSYDGY